MFDRSKFIDIEPYDGPDCEAACRRLKEHPEYVYALATGLFPGIGEEVNRQRMGFTGAVLQRLDEVHSYDDFQKKITCDVCLETLLKTSVTSFTYSGQEKLDPERSYLFISNHRDIVLDCALLDLGLQRTGGVVSGHHGDLRGHGLVGLDDLVQGLLHGGGGKDVQLHRLGGSLRGGVVSGVVRGGIAGVRAAAAGGQGQGQREGQEQGEKLFHGRSSFLHDNLLKPALQVRCQTNVIFKRG